MVRSYVLKRDVTRRECPWLDKDLQVGTTVYEYSGCTYGCVTSNGIAVTAQANKTPFFEIPYDSV